MLNFFQTAKLLVTNTKEFIVYNELYDEKHHIKVKYCTLKCLLFAKSVVNYLIKQTDIIVDKIQCTKEFNDGDTTVIISSKSHLSKLIKKTDNICSTNSLGNTLFYKFEITSPNFESVCLKKYVLKYRDFNKLYNNSLYNICVFNDVNVNMLNSPDCKVNVTLFKEGKFITNSLDYNKCKDLHINDFSSLKN